MTPEQKIKHLVVNIVTGDPLPDVTSENVDELYDNLDESRRYDVVYELREGAVETNIKPPYSRHYESQSVATETPGGWVGWTYWFGGGKHGNPEEIKWMSDAYDLSCVEEEKTITVQIFTKV